MKGKDIKYLIDTVQNDGFHYAFNHYSDFKEIEDEGFHRKLSAYLEAVEDLAEYIGCEDEI